MADEIVIRVKRTRLAPPGVTLSLSTGSAHRVIVEDSAIEFVEVGDTHIRFNSGVLLPGETAPSSDGISRPGLDVIAACLQYAKNRPGKTIIVAGHTDTTASDEYNVTLSRIRAEAVHGLLAGDRDEFAHACWGPHLTQEQRYPDGGSGKKKGVLWDDYTDVLNWAAATFGWPCGYPAGNPTLWNATVKFQQSYNASDIRGSHPAIAEHGTFNEETWRAVYDCYNRALAERLATDEDGLGAMRQQVVYYSEAQPKVACGEFQPIDNVGRDEYRSQTNRRVEVLFLDSDEKPAIPCIDTGACSPADCELYDTTKWKRKNLPIDPANPFPSDTDLIKVRLHDHAAHIMPETFYQYRFSAGESWSGSYQADTDGWAQVPQPPVCPATIQIQWESLGSDNGVEFFLYSRELYVDCGTDSVSSDADALGTQRLHDLGYDDKRMARDEAEAAFRTDYQLQDDQDTNTELERIFKDKDCDATRPA